MHQVSDSGLDLPTQTSGYQWVSYFAEPVSARLIACARKWGFVMEHRLSSLAFAFVAKLLGHARARSISSHAPPAAAARSSFKPNPPQAASMTKHSLVTNTESTVTCAPNPQVAYATRYATRSASGGNPNRSALCCARPTFVVTRVHCQHVRVTAVRFPIQEGASPLQSATPPASDTSLRTKPKR